MVVVSPAPASLDTNLLSLYYTKDALLANLPVLVFHGPSTTTNSTFNSSRIQAHVYSLAGFQSFPRLTISPASPLYTAVNHLPEDRRGDPICRGLAVSLLKYFAEMPREVKSSLEELTALNRSDSRAPAMFDEMHAGDLASKMVRVENSIEIANYVMSALSQQVVSWVDVDLLLPAGSIERGELSENLDKKRLYRDDGSPPVDYGKFASLVDLFGSPAFLPTSKLRRAPSRPTAMSRTRILARDQKESLRREMCELLDTEERYVGKLYDLVNSAAVEFVRFAKTNTVASTSASGKAMQRLFPECLTDILNINTAFMKCIRTILETSENDAIDDIQSSAEADEQPSLKTRTRPKDLTGTAIFAKALLEWFPRFKGPYQEYLRASSDFPKILNDLLRDSMSQFSTRIQATGEQRLRSWLIEPVQRLPRYSLFIDNMVNLLPATHPAMNKFLKARDLVTDICALDNDLAVDSTLVATRLRDLVSAWPASLHPCGRLITAVDVAELKPPYQATNGVTEGEPSMILLFQDSIVVIRKSSPSSMSSRGVLAEIDRPTSNVFSALPGNDSDSASQRGLAFASSFELDDTQFTESCNGRLLSMAYVRRSADVECSRTVYSRSCHAITKVFSLLGSYEGKAARWSEEVARARIEQRFPENLRESDKWALRSINVASDGFGILTTIFEKDCVDVDGNRAFIGQGQTKIVVNQCGNENIGRVLDRGLEITATITILDNGHYRLDFDGPGGYSCNDNVTKDDFTAVLTKRLGNLLRNRHQPHNLESAQTHISFNQQVVETLPFRATVEESQGRRFRPVSPVKAISNFLAGSIKDSSTPSKDSTNRPHSKDISVLVPPNILPETSRSHQRSAEERESNKITLIGASSTDSRDSINHLEKSFMAYTMALRSRGGNIVGRVLRGRASADELIVNELSNTLVEDPSKLQAAAEVSVDVLFAAFEKFLNKVWTPRMGPILASDMPRKMQSVLDLPRTSQNLERFNILMGEMTPQNHRAFTTMIKLLYDLLEASGNDGDRGALMATFSEVLVLEGNPHRYIGLLDRLVEDHEVLLDANPPFRIENSNGASDPLKRSRSINTGSLSSNASSIRKRFGFGTTLTRENSRNDAETMVGSVWRTLSKNTRGFGDAEAQSSSLSKSFLLRSRSIENDNRRPLLPRPVSQGRPPSPSSVPGEEPYRRPGSTHNTLSSLTTIGEGPASIIAIPSRKKRRSSLSDLMNGVNPGSSYVSSPAQLRVVNSPENTPQKARAAMRAPSPTKLQTFPEMKEQSPPRLEPINRKGNLPPLPRKTLAEIAVNRNSDEMADASFGPQKRNNNPTGIPALKPRPQDRRSPTSSSDGYLKKSGSSPQKLRLQSPQKLRERLQIEQKAIQEASGGLQAELAKIGEEISALNLNRPVLRATTADSDFSLVARFTALESRVSKTLIDLPNRITTIQADLDSSLVVSEKKCRTLDGLYKEANAENEALYDRFNEELSKVLKGVRGGQGVEEVRLKLKEAQEEAGRLKKENWRLKRENLGLKSQLRED